MKNPVKFIFPGLLVGISFMVVLASLFSVKDSAHAFSNPTKEITSRDASSTPTSPSPSRQENVEQIDSNCRVPIRYPHAIRRWCNLIQIEAEKNNLQQDLIAAVILQESGGNPSAYSRSGATGLMQVMPRDGIAASFKCKNGPCFSSRPSMEELFDPQFNIQYGVKMLAGLVRKFGSVRDALKAYGPMDVGYTYADKVLSIYQNYR